MLSGLPSPGRVGENRLGRHGTISQQTPQEPGHVLGFAVGLLVRVGQQIAGATLHGLAPRDARRLNAGNGLALLQVVVKAPVVRPDVGFAAG